MSFSESIKVHPFGVLRRQSRGRARLDSEDLKEASRHERRPCTRVGEKHDNASTLYFASPRSWALRRKNGGTSEPARPASSSPLEVTSERPQSGWPGSDYGRRSRRRARTRGRGASRCAWPNTAERQRQDRGRGSKRAGLGRLAERMEAVGEARDCDMAPLLLPGQSIVDGPGPLRVSSGSPMHDARLDSHYCSSCPSPAMTHLVRRTARRRILPLRRQRRDAGQRPQGDRRSRPGSRTSCPCRSR